MDESCDFEFLPAEKSDINQNPGMDPNFLELITIPPNSSEVQLHPDNFAKLFQNPDIAGLPLTIFLVTGPHFALNSDVIGIILQNLQSGQQDEVITTSNFFLGPKDDYNSTGLVAFSQPVITNGGNGKVANFFLDIWGTFQNDADQNYTLLSGLGAALASTIIYIGDGQITDPNWTYLRKLGSICKKILLPFHIGMPHLILLIQNWDLSKHKVSGRSGGQKYMKALNSSSNPTKDMTIVLQSLSPSCFTFPKIEGQSHTDPGTLAQQHIKALSQFISLYQKSKQKDGINAEYPDIFEMFKNLPEMSDLLQFQDVDETLETSHRELRPANEATSKDVCGRNFPAESIHDADMNPVLEESKLQQQSGKIADTSGHNADNMEWDFETEASDGIGSNPTISCNSSIQISKDIEEEWARATEYGFDFENDEVMDVDTASKDDSKALSKCLSTDFKISTTLPSTVGKEEERKTGLPQTNHTMKIETPEEILDRILQKNKQTSPQWSFKMPDVLIPKVKNPEKIGKILDNSTLPQHNDAKEHVQLSHNPVPRPRSTTAQKSSLPSDEAQILQIPSQMVPAPINTYTIPEDIMSSAIQVFSSLKLGSEVQLSAIVQKILCHFNNNHLDQEIPAEDGQATVKSFIQPALLAIKTYQEEIDAVFEQQMCFDSDQEYQEMVSNLRSKINLQMLRPLKKVVEEKLNEITTLFKNLNADILQKEHETAIYVTQRLTTFYNETMTPTPNSIKYSNGAELKKLHDTTLEFCKNAFNHAFGRPSSTLGNKALHDLCDTLNTSFSTAEKKLNDTLSRDKATRASLVSMFGNRYKSEMDRDLRNPVYNASHFPSLHETAFKAAVQGLKEESKHLLPALQETCHKELQVQIEELRENFKHNFDSQKPAPVDNTQAQITVQHNQSPKPAWRTANGSKTLAAQHFVDGTPIPVGIHFGLDKISAGIYKPDGSFQTIYKPRLNQVAFSDEIMITNIPQGKSYNIFSMRKHLTEKNIETNIKVEINGSQVILRVEEVLAYIFAQLHQILKGILHTNKISYAITYPSSFNKTMWTVLKDATAIAGIHAILVRESDAILGRHISSKTVEQESTTILVAVEDDESKGSDIVTYENCNGRLQLQQIFGYSASSYVFGLGYTTGMQECVKHLPKNIQQSESPKVFLCRIGPKRRATNFKVFIDGISGCNWVEPVKIEEVMEGAAVLARFYYDPEFKANWEHQYAFANLEKILKTLPSPSTLTHAQIWHVGKNLPEDSVNGKAAGVQATMRQQFDHVASVKDGIRQEYLKIKDDLGSRRDGKDKKSILDALDDTIRKITNDHVSAGSANAQWNQILERVRNFR